MTALREKGDELIGPGMHVLPPARRRVVALDIARTAALVGMVVYHLTFDLEMFGYLAPGTSVTGGWAVFARLIAGSFMFLVGVNLYLAHGKGIRWRPFLRRLLMLAIAAAAITALTRYAMPETFIFFGILHSIAVASVLGLFFLRLPALLPLVAAAAILVAKPYLAGTGFFDAPWLAWLGLTGWPVRSADFVPVFPWFAASLAGIGFAKLAARAGLWRRLGVEPGAEGKARRLLAWPGRHSLAVYLLHQPVLISAVWVYSRLSG